MIKVEIIKNNIVTNQATFQNQQLVASWLAQEIANNSFGKPDRWLSFMGEPDQGYTDTRQVEDKTEYFYPCEYQIQQTDITAEHNQEQINLEAERYLKDTDWYILREMDSGVACPSHIKAQRQAARSSIVR